MIRPLQNLTCPYCAASIDRERRTKEHVIGRRFVPRGSLDGSWNIVLWACATCNGGKSDLEDDISAITMHFHTAGLRGMDDVVLQQEALRKSANSFSRKTRKRVADSSATVNMRAPLGVDGAITASFTAPPQLGDDRAEELARLQMMGFFYLLTYDDVARVGHPWPGDFWSVHGAIKTDWGNVVHRAFMKIVEAWDYRLIATTANGYYRALIRRHPAADCWAWAVEWNRSYRLVGFFGDYETAMAISQTIPEVPVQPIAQGPGHWVSFREEQALPDSEDTMFRMPD